MLELRTIFDQADWNQGDRYRAFICCLFCSGFINLKIPWSRWV